jgi:hypothetical protein
MTAKHPDGGAIRGERKALREIGCNRCSHCFRIKHLDEFSKTRNACKPCLNAWQKNYLSKNKEIAHAMNVRRRRANLSSEALAILAAKDKSPKRRKSGRERAAKKRKTIEGMLKNRISSSMSRRLTSGKQGWKTESIVGYSITELREHIEKQFLEGMTWDNRRDWHIDHIIPLASFSISGVDDPELKRAWALTNLRPIWAADNLRKNARMEFLI